jgi:hypothetical protein
VLIGKRKPEYEKAQANAKDKLTTDATKIVNVSPVESTPTNTNTTSTQMPISQTDQNVIADNTNTNK